MNKNYLACIAFLFTFSALLAQNTVPSSCVAADSITKKYRTDAARLSVRNTFLNNTTYKDSTWIDPTLRNFYQRALLAVYNATSLPARDTVVIIYNIHTDLNPELNTLHILAPPAQTWMLELKANQSPTSHPTVNALINKYSLGFTYYQNNINDKVIFTSDSNLNLVPLVLAFQNAQGVSSASIEPSFNDIKNIVDTVGTGFVKLSYSIGWGSCADGCDLRRYWHFKVYADCSVEYLGSSGSSLFLGLNSNNNNISALSVYPNPASGSLNLLLPETEKTYSIKVTDVNGRLVLLTEGGGNAQISLDGFDTGIYQVRAESEGKVLKARFVKD